MARIRYDGLQTTLGADITSTSATSITFASALQSMGANIPTLAAGEYLALVIDNEILYLTAYTSGATSGTVTRGEEQTTAATHSSGATVLHAPTAIDFDWSVSNSSGLLDASQVNHASATATYTVTTNAALEAVDSTNLKLMFVAPDSGKVLLDWSAHLGGPNAYIGWAKAATPTVIEQGSYAYFDTTIDTGRYSGRHLLTGLTPGQSYTYVLVWRLAFGSGTLTMYHGVGGYGPIVLTAQAVGGSGSSSGGVLYAVDFSGTPVTEGQDTDRTSGSAYGSHGGDVLFFTPVRLNEIKWDINTTTSATFTCYVDGIQFGSPATISGPTTDVTFTDSRVLSEGVHSIDWVRNTGTNTVHDFNGNSFTGTNWKLNGGATRYGSTTNSSFSPAFKLTTIAGEWAAVLGGAVGFVLPPFSYSGTVTTFTGGHRWYNDTGKTLTMNFVRASVGTAPSGSALVVDVNKNGTSIFSSSANQPTITAGTTTDTAVPDVATLAPGDYLTVDVDSVGSSTAGSNLTVQIVV